MAENRRGRDNRRYFSRGQLVLLGAAFAFASLIIFVLGIFVGQGIEARKLMKKDEPLAKIPVDPADAESSRIPTPSKTEITFNAALPKSDAAMVSADDPSKAVKPVEKAGTAGNQGPRAPTERPRAESGEKKRDKPANAAKKTATPAPAETKDTGQGWRAQVNAFPDERSAKLVVDRLKDKGYNAYVTEVENRGKTWYRVNVGKYGSRDEANRMVEVLRTKENFPKAFAANR